MSKNYFYISIIFFAIILFIMSSCNSGENVIQFTPKGVFLHALLLENTNANPTKPLNLAELEIYTNHTRQGVNLATNMNNSITSGMVGNFGGSANVADRLIDGVRDNDQLTDLYHSGGDTTTENWVKLTFDPPIFVATNEPSFSLVEFVLYNRLSFQERAEGINIHLLDDMGETIVNFGEGLSLSEVNQDIISIPFDLSKLNTAPMIESTFPADNQNNVGISGTQIILSFDQRVNQSTGSITLSGGESPVTFAQGDSRIAYNANNVIITLTNPLKTNTTYTLTLASGSFNSSVNDQNNSEYTLSFTTAKGVFLHSLLLENTNANPTEPLNLAELEIYTNHTRQGVNLATNMNNSITSGMVGNFGGSANVADRLIDGVRDNDQLTDLYHSGGDTTTENWVKLTFDPPIFVATNEPSLSLVEVVVYNRSIFQERAEGINIHLLDDMGETIVNFGGGISLSEVNQDIISILFDLSKLTTAPMIESTSLANNEVNINPFNLEITLSFDQRVDQSTGSITLSGGDSPDTFAQGDSRVTYNGNDLIIRFTSSLKADTTYTLTLSAGAFKSGSDQTSLEHTLSFTTIPFQNISTLLISDTNAFYEADADDGSFEDTINIVMPIGVNIKDTHRSSSMVFGTDLGNQDATAQVPINISDLPSGLSLELTANTNMDGKVTSIDLALTGNSANHIGRDDNVMLNISLKSDLFDVNTDVYMSEDIPYVFSLNFIIPGWSPRQSHQTLIYDNKLWVMGGDDGSRRNDIWSSSDGGTNWTKIITQGDIWQTLSGGRDGFVYDSKIWSIGEGRDGSFRLNDVWTSTNGVNWKKITGGIKDINNNFTAAVIGIEALEYNNKLWVLGGNDTSDEVNDIFVSSDGGVSWNQVMTSGTIWSGRSGHQAFAYNNKLWVIGGNDINNLFNDIWVSSDGGVTWTQVTTVGTVWSGRSGHQAIAYNNKLWVIGGKGSNNNLLNDIWVSSDGGVTWTQVTTVGTVWSGRSGHQAIAYNNKLWVIGGKGSNNNLLNDIWISSNEGVTWQEIIISIY